MNFKNYLKHMSFKITVTHGLKKLGSLMPDTICCLLCTYYEQSEQIGTFNLYIHINCGNRQSILTVGNINCQWVCMCI